MGFVLSKLASLTLVALLAGTAGCVADTDAVDPDEEVGIDEADAEEVDTVELGLSGSFAGTAEKTHARRINDRRARRGVRRLNRRACLNTVARNWAARMAAAGSISHNPNVGAQVRSRCGLSWRSWGENVGSGFSEASIWQAFLGSSPHRANIDRARWDSMGVGIYKRTDGKMFLAQVFVDF